MIDLLILIALSGIAVYFAYKEGVKHGAERAIDALENQDFIEIDKISGDIKPVHWEYVYSDREEEQEGEGLRPKKQKKKQ